MQENEKVDWCFEINILEHAKEKPYLFVQQEDHLTNQDQKIYKLEKYFQTH